MCFGEMLNSDLSSQVLHSLSSLYSRSFDYFTCKRQYYFYNHIYYQQGTNEKYASDSQDLEQLRHHTITTCSELCCLIRGDLGHLRRVCVRAKQVVTRLCVRAKQGGHNQIEFCTIKPIVTNLTGFTRLIHSSYTP